MDFFKNTRDEMKLIFGKLSLRDAVVFHYGCSKECRELMITGSRVFEGEPFFLHYSILDSNPSYYAYSLERWVQLLLPTGLPWPVPFRDLRPVSASGGLLLFSAVPGFGRVNQLDSQCTWWPLVVVNPITRENRWLLYRFELPRDLGRRIWYPKVYSDIVLGLKVNADFMTYKVVVYWKTRRVVQIFDSGSNQWSTLLALQQLEPYANSSNEIVLCRNCGPGNALRSSVFDIGHGMPIDIDFIEGRIFRERIRRAITPHALNARKSVIVGESCLYVLSYNEFPTTYARIHKKERSNINWQLVTEAPWRELLNRIENLGTDGAQSAGLSWNIYECGQLLLFAVSYSDTWGGALYDLEKQVWDPHFVVNRNRGRHDDGLFFQPQLNGPPC